MNSTYLGVDLGGTNLRCAVVDEENQVLSRVESPTHAHEGPEAVIDRVVAGMIKAASTAGLDLGGDPGGRNRLPGSAQPGDRNGV